jgi:hypothetical protein
MASRAQQLGAKKAELQTQCALQRQQLANLSAQVEARLSGADFALDLAFKAARNPIVLVAGIAGLLIIGPWRIMRWVGQAVTAYKLLGIARRLIDK